MPQNANNKPKMPRVTTWAVTFIAAIVLLLKIAYHPHHQKWYTTTTIQHHRGGATLARELQSRMETDDGGDVGGGAQQSKNQSIPSHRRQEHYMRQPRILTLLTTYGNRTGFARANRDALEERGDGFESQMFVASDEDDEDMDGAVDYKYGLAHNHRLLGAITEAYARHKGEFEWMAIGDDDTVFLYKRATAFLNHINHTQPVAFGSVDGIDPDVGRARTNAKCFSPSEKEQSGTASSSPLADRGCCRDFTRPCRVPPFPSTGNTPRNHKRLRPTWLKTDADEDPRKDETSYWTFKYGKGGLFWPYGGSGLFLSAGLLEAVQQGGGGGGDGDGGGGRGYGSDSDSNSDSGRGRRRGSSSSGGNSGTGGGWARCTEMFGIGYATDLQLGMCLRAHGLTTSTYLKGFDRTCQTSNPDEIEDRLAASCQVLGIHLGVRHLIDDKLFTVDAFKDAADAVHREDTNWASPTGPYMAQTCPKAFGAISMRRRSYN